MKFTYKAISPLQKFGEKVYNLLVENCTDTFYVGGMVRDALLDKQITDIDIATAFTPEKVCTLLKQNNIQYSDNYIMFGVIVAKRGKLQIEIATLRKDLPAKTRYNEVKYVSSVKLDSARRDFTINALYLRQKDGLIMDFHSGLKDLKARQIRFIGNPDKRILQDPLRIVRALRFTKQLNFSLENNTAKAIVKHWSELKNITKTKLDNEIFKLSSKKMQNNFRKLINRKTLDFFLA